MSDDDPQSAPEPAHKMGDKVAAVTEVLGFKPRPGCGCKKRQRALNRVRIDQKPLDVVKDIVKAVTTK